MCQNNTDRSWNGERLGKLGSGGGSGLVLCPQPADAEVSLPVPKLALLTREIIKRTGERVVQLFWLIKSYHSSQPDEHFSLGGKSTPTERGFKTPQKGSTRPVYSTSEWVYCQV